MLPASACPPPGRDQVAEVLRRQNAQRLPFISPLSRRNDRPGGRNLCSRETAGRGHVRVGAERRGGARLWPFAAFLSLSVSVAGRCCRSARRLEPVLFGAKTGSSQPHSLSLSHTHTHTHTHTRFLHLSVSSHLVVDAVVEFPARSKSRPFYQHTSLKIRGGKVDLHGCFKRFIRLDSNSRLCPTGRCYSDQDGGGGGVLGGHSQC